MTRSVTIDCFPEAACRYRAGYAVVAIDVIRATTTAITAAADGRRCFPVASLKSALALAQRLPDCLLIGEIAGEMPAGFDMSNSPVTLLANQEKQRPVVMLSSSGTELIVRSAEAEVAYLACLRNKSAVAQHLAAAHERVALIGAGSRKQFREEDQLCCAWIAEALMASGFTAENKKTENIVARWKGVPLHAILVSESVKYLIRSGQEDDLEFVLAHIDDVHEVFTLRSGEIVPVVATEPLPVAA